MRLIVLSRIAMAAGLVFVLVIIKFLYQQTVQNEKRIHTDPQLNLVGGIITRRPSLAAIGEYNELNTEYTEKINMTSFSELWNKSTSLFAPNETKTRIIDPTNPNDITQWWQAVTILDWYINKAELRYKCANIKSYSNYDLCQDSEVEIKPPCLVYSIGIGRDFSFDEALGKIGCEVHSFDPSMFKDDHKHNQNVTFHNLGIGAMDNNTFVPHKDLFVKYDQTWKLLTLSSIKKKLGHENRVIDVLKIDIEGYEYNVIKNILDTGMFKYVRQFVTEIHFLPWYPLRDQTIDCYKMYLPFRASGMQEFKRLPNAHQRVKSLYVFWTDVSFVNTKFAKR